MRATCSILGKADADMNAEAVITSPEEARLLLTVSKFPERVIQALNAYEPSMITRYIIELCTAFNRFYQACPIITAGKQKREEHAPADHEGSAERSRERASSDLP